MEFTPEQQQAITLHNSNILVSAAAGSGKTAVLTERIVRMVCDPEHPVDIDRILVVTFTNAAAAEMRERISQAILKKLNENGSDENLQRQSALLHNAQITTIDSFCLFILRNNFHDIGLDPAFRVADEGELTLMKQDILAELLEDKFSEGKEEFYDCVEYFCPNGKEDVLEKQIFELYQYAMSYPFPEDWLLERKQDYHLETIEDIEKSSWGEYLLYYLQNMLSSCVEQMEEVTALIEQPDGPYMYGEVVEQEKELLTSLSNLNSLTDMSVKISAMQFLRLPGKKDESVNPLKKEQAQTIRDGVKDTIKKLQTTLFTTSLEAVVRQSKECEKAVCTLVDLCLDFKQRLDDKKREKKLLDFSDMEHMALQILLTKDEEGHIVATKTAKEYQDYFEEVLIDEYQDSNLVQEYLLQAVSREEDGNFNRFMVGDVKQSIYKFRLARPTLFMEKYEAYSLGEGKERRIDLHQNYRSRKEVVDAVNTVFSKIMTKKLGGIVYDDAAALYAGASYPENQGCESELILFEKPDKESDYDAKQIEAKGIANKIKDLLKNYQVTDKATGELRKTQYKDIVILLRSGNGWDEELRQTFEKEGIPAYIASKTGYFQTKEIQDVLQFLRVLDNPCQDIALFGVMKSMFGGFTDEEAAIIKSAYVKKVNESTDKKEQADAKEPDQDEDSVSMKLDFENGLYACLVSYAERFDENLLQESEFSRESDFSQESEFSQEDALAQKCSQFLSMINRYRSYLSYMPILELLQKLTGEFHYLEYVAALPAGSKRLANVEMLLTKAAAFEKNSYYGLYHFVRYIEQLEKYSVDYGEANTLDESANVVRIMSIHKSKGLEFPIAIVAGLSKKFNIQDTTQAVIMDMDMGIGIDYVNSDIRIRSKSLRKNTLAIKMKLENLAEEIRVLYVAMTRAREKLIMTGSMKFAEEEEEDIQTSSVPNHSDGIVIEPQSFGKLVAANSYLDLLLPVFPNIRQVKIDDIHMEEIKEGISQAGRWKDLLQSANLVNDQNGNQINSQDDEIINQAINEEELEMLNKRFHYQYPHKNLEKLYTKTTVSELKMAAMAEHEELPPKELFPEKEIMPYIPSFMKEEEKVSGTTRGSAMHKVMELLDFTKDYQNITNLQDAINGYHTEGCLSDEYAEAVRIDKIHTFLTSPLARRMQEAATRNELYREQPFVYGIGAERLSKGENKFPEGETVLIQGIVDAFFYEEDGIILLDYKTDVIQSPEELVNRYKVQLDYYEEALTSLTGKPVKERILYSFYLGRAICC